MTLQQMAITLLLTGTVTVPMDGCPCERCDEIEAREREWCEAAGGYFSFRCLDDENGCAVTYEAVCQSTPFGDLTIIAE